MQVNGENCLLPVDADIDNESQLSRQTVRLHDQLLLMADRVQTSILLLDCCRDNPFSRSLVRGAGKTRSMAATRGMAAMDSAQGSLIAFATGPGDVASDGAGEHSPFTAALLDVLRKPDMSLTDMLTEVARKVRGAATGKGRVQTPWYHSSLSDRFFFSRPLPLPRRCRPVRRGQGRHAEWCPGRYLRRHCGPCPRRPADPPAFSDTPSPAPSHWMAWALSGFGLVTLALALIFWGGDDKRIPPVVLPAPAPVPTVLAETPVARLVARLGDINAGDEALRRRSLRRRFPAPRPCPRRTSMRWQSSWCGWRRTIPGAGPIRTGRRRRPGQGR